MKHSTAALLPLVLGVVATSLLAESARALLQAGCSSNPPVVEILAEHGAWDGPWMFTSNYNDTCDEIDTCVGIACTAPPNGIAHAMLLPKGSHAGCVLFVDEAGRVSIWNPAVPSRVEGDIHCSFPGPSNPLHWGSGCEYSLFCSGHTPLADGRIIFAGGVEFPPVVDGQHETTLFNPAQLDGSVDPWEHGPQMLKQRYYPTIVTMLAAFGARPLVLGGTEQVGPLAGNGIREWERLDGGLSGLDCNMATTLMGIEPFVDPSNFTEFEYYPRMHQLADGNGTFYIAGDTNSGKTQDCGGEDNDVGETWFLTPPVGTETFGTLVTGPVDPVGNRYYGSSVLLHQFPENGGANRVIIFGGSNGCDNGDPLSECCNGIVTVHDGVVELDYQPGSTSQLVSKAPLLCPRVFSNAVILPTGDVFISRGSSRDNHNMMPPGLSPIPLDNPELYTPGPLKTGGASKYMAAITSILSPCNPTYGGKPARTYHHIALLLADGRVLVAGGNEVCGFGTSSFSGEAFKPPYFFQDFSTQISQAPADVYFRQPFGFSFSMESVPPAVTIDPLSTIDRVVLIRTGSVTHHQDYSQRYVELSFTITSIAVPLEDPTGMVGTITATAPGPLRAPPGYYLLFAVGSDGVVRVPSQGALVRLQ